MQANDPRLLLLASEAKVRPPHVFFVYHMIAANPKAFDPAACAVFAQLELRHVEAIVAALRAGGLLPERRQSGRGLRSPEEKATRLPADFQVPNEWIQWSQVERRWPRDVAETEAHKFVDHWSAIGGKHGLKTRWEATWRNWVRGPYSPASGDWHPEGVGELTPDIERAKIAENEAFLERIGRG